MDLEEQYKIELVFRYLLVAAACCICFDYFITIKKEIELVWKAPNSFMKHGFLVYRYLAIAGTVVLAYSASGSGAIDVNFCRRGIPTLALLQTCSLAFADLIAVLHTSAIWNRSFRVLITLALCYVVTFFIGLAGRVSSLPYMIDSTSKFNPTDSCVVRVRDIRIIISWAAGSLFDLIALIFNVAKPLFQDDVDVPYLRSLRIYGTGYFIFNFVFRTTCVFSFLFDPSWMPNILPALTWPITTVTLSRFIFKARKLGQRRKTEDLELERTA